MERWGENARPLNEVAVLAGWSTALAADSRGSAGVGKAELPNQAMLAGWPTTTTTDAARTGNLSQTEPNVTLTHAVQRTLPARITACGTLLTGCFAGMDGGGPLNPAHSRWLMGLLPVWDACAVTAMPSSRKSRKRSSALISGTDQ